MPTQRRRTSSAVLIPVLCLLLVATISSAMPTRGASIPHIPFISNAGQTDADVSFYAQTFGGTVFVTQAGGIVYALPDPSQAGAGVSLREVFVHGTTHPAQGEGSSRSDISYFGDRDPKTWKTAIPSYESVSLGEVYDNIVVKLRAKGHNVEKLFFIAPTGDPQDIKLDIQGAIALDINREGELAVETELGVCTFTKPVAYQDQLGQRTEVEVAYVVDGCQYGFQVGDYDVNQMLVIDPLLASTFVGGNDDDEPYEPCVAVDGNGFVFFTGQVLSTDFPTTPGAYRLSSSGGSDRVVSKYSSDLSTLVASTFIGHRNDESGMAICIDDNDDVYIAGYTNSTGFPTTAGAYDRAHNGVMDAFVAKLDNNLTTLLASTFFGGSDLDGGEFPRIDLGLGSDGSVYVAGLTNSTDLPTNSASYNPNYRGDQDVFVARFSSDLSTLMASTYLGGSTDEWRPSIQVGNGGNIFVSGTTRAGFPTTYRSYCPSFNGGMYDMFIAKLSGDLSTLLASTYLGSNGEDNLKGIRLDAHGNVYCAGVTSSPNYPTTPGAYDESHNGAYDICVSKLSNDLRDLMASTFVGGSTHDDGEDVYLDGDGNVHVVGSTNSVDYPTTADAHDDTYNGSDTGLDIAYLILDEDLSELKYATYFGNGYNKGKGIVVNESAEAYITGIAYHPNFPTTDGCYDNTYGGGDTDCFIAKFGPTTTGINLQSTPQGFHLHGNFPNPFNPSTDIAYSVAGDGYVDLTVYDQRGRLVTKLVSAYQKTGNYTVRWDGRNTSGASVASGIYTCRLQAGPYVQNRQMSLIK